MTSAVFDEEGSSAAAEFAGMFEEKVGVVGVYFLENDDVIGVGLLIRLALDALHGVG